MSLVGIFRSALYQAPLHGKAYRIENLCEDGKDYIDSFPNDRLAFMDFSKTLESVKHQGITFRFSYGAFDPHLPEEFNSLKERLVTLKVESGCSITWLFCNKFSAQEAYDVGLLSVAQQEQSLSIKKTKFRKPLYAPSKSMDVSFQSHLLAPIFESKEDKEDEFAPVSISTMASLSNPYVSRPRSLTKH